MNTFLTAIVVAFSMAMAGQEARPAPALSGRVVHADLPLPGATITATRGDRRVTTTSDENGVFRFASLDPGPWTIKVEMRGFAAAASDVAIPYGEQELRVTLKMQPYTEIMAAVPRAPLDAPGSPKPATPPEPPPTPADDPDIINGSVINGASTPFAQPRAIGNNRPRMPRLYNGNVTTALANSAWNARPYSFGGSAAPADTSDLQLNFTLGGPLRIPWVIEYGPNMTLGLQHGVAHNATTQSAFMPTPAERLGDLSQSAVVVRDPLTGLAFAGNVIPGDRISPQAAALLAYYPQPNTTTTTGANFQRPIETTTRQDGAQFRTQVAVTRRDTIAGTVSGRRTITGAVNLFAFTDRRRQVTFDTGLTWTHTFSPRLQLRASYQFTKADNALTPFFANRANVSGDAGIAGNEQSPLNWGPPTVAFPTFADLSDGEYQRASTTTQATGASLMSRRGRHNVTFGGDIRRTGFDQASQPNPRGTLSFTGAATGEAFADFLLGLPTTSSIAFGATSTLLRGLAYDAYVTDDFRLAAGITLNVGVRWEYEAPFTEASGRLVNFDVAPAFAAVSPVLATHPVGALTGAAYPPSLLRPDRAGLQPRLAASWRPILASSLVIRAGYGLYRNLGVYQSLAQLLAQQPPFSRTFSLQNSPATPLTLANPFPASPPTNSNTFAIDPDFRMASVHSWQVTAQREFPASMTVIGGYFGDKGTHLMQAFLPNTYPGSATGTAGQAGPSGFVYVTSHGSSIRNAAQLTVRRRLRSGFTASAQYTFAKATDDAATFNNRGTTPGSLAVAQDWLDLGAERGPSSFDQRHLLSVQVQYSTGLGITGGTLVDGVRGSLFKGWTIDGRLNTGSGMPFTPLAFLAVTGTGVVGVRPRLTGLSPAPTTAGAYANAAAYATPLPGTWGNAGRNSIRGPSQFSCDLSVSRTFQFPRRLRLEWRVNVTNLLNRVTFSTINTTVTSPQFGLPTHANAMRRIQTTFLFGF